MDETSSVSRELWGVADDALWVWSLSGKGTEVAENPFNAGG